MVEGTCGVHDGKFWSLPLYCPPPLASRFSGREIHDTWDHESIETWPSETCFLSSRDFESYLGRQTEMLLIDDLHVCCSYECATTRPLLTILIPALSHLKMHNQNNKFHGRLARSRIPNASFRRFCSSETQLYIHPRCTIVPPCLVHGARFARARTRLKMPLAPHVFPTMTHDSIFTPWLRAQYPAYLVAVPSHLFCPVLSCPFLPRNIPTNLQIALLPPLAPSTKKKNIMALDSFARE